jgi:hypothetical protein
MGIQKARGKGRDLRQRQVATDFGDQVNEVDRLAAQFVGAIGGCVVIVETTDDAHALALQRFSPGVRR